MYHPTYLCQRIPRELELTGKLDDPLWQQAEAVELTDPTTGEPHPLTAHARVLYSESHLYVGFDCVDDYILATFTERDSEVWNEGCFEVFLAPSGKMRQYYELNVGALNTIFDTFILNGTEPGKRWRINSFIRYNMRGLTTKVHVNGELNVIGGAQGWTAEYAIPFSSLIGNDHLVPEPGDEWCMNLCHIASPKKEKEFGFYSWCTIGKMDFHAPWYYGTLRFA